MSSTLEVCAPCFRHVLKLEGAHLGPTWVEVGCPVWPFDDPYPTGSIRSWRACLFAGTSSPETDLMVDKNIASGIKDKTKLQRQLADAEFRPYGCLSSYTSDPMHVWSRLQDHGSNFQLGSPLSLRQPEIFCNGADGAALAEILDDLTCLPNEDPCPCWLLMKFELLRVHPISKFIARSWTLQIDSARDKSILHKVGSLNIEHQEIRLALLWWVQHFITQTR